MTGLSQDMVFLCFSCRPPFTQSVEVPSRIWRKRWKMVHWWFTLDLHWICIDLHWFTIDLPLIYLFFRCWFSTSSTTSLSGDWLTDGDRIFQVTTCCVPPWRWLRRRRDEKDDRRDFIMFDGLSFSITWGYGMEMVWIWYGNGMIIVWYKPGSAK